jgi:3-deoxy-D-manno-octulosonic-acid transferase
VSTRFTLVAGSTWPSDEERLFPAWVEVKKRHREVRMIIAPHELPEERLASIEAWARSNGITSARVAHAAGADADIVIVDRYGILGDLYALADVAYVGGGFRNAGLHSLLEPAAFGAPVIVGPRHEDNRDAQLLVAAGGAFRCPDASAIESRVTRWIESSDSLERARDAARSVVHKGLGAAERSVEIVERLIYQT